MSLPRAPEPEVMDSGAPAGDHDGAASDPEPRAAQAGAGHEAMDHDAENTCEHAERHTCWPDPTATVGPNAGPLFGPALHRDSRGAVATEAA